MKLMRLLFLLFMLVLNLGLLAQDNCVEENKKIGYDCFNKGKYTDALFFFEQAIKCDPGPNEKQLAELKSLIQRCEKESEKESVKTIGTEDGKNNEVTLKLLPSKLSIEAKTIETQKVEIKTNAKSIKVSEPFETSSGKGRQKDIAYWCTIDAAGNIIYVTCEENEKIEERKCEITVTADGKKAVLKIIQHSADLMVNFEPSLVELSGQGESKTVIVQTNSKDWSIEDYPSWLEVERIGNGLRISCTKNSYSYKKQGNVVIKAANELFYLDVVQSPGDAVLEIGGQTREVVLNDVDPRGGFVVKSNMPDWKVYPVDDWITVKRDQDSVIVTAEVNPSVLSRQGKVRVSCKNRQCDVVVYQRPHVSNVKMPESELKVLTNKKESIAVTSFPTELVVYIDDSITRTTPFKLNKDYEFHSMSVGFESRDFIFNEKQQEIVFEPGLRFAAFTFTAPKNIGLMTGFVSSNNFGAYSHFQASRPMVKQFASDTTKADGYHFMVGPVYQPIQYAAVYAGLGVGIHEGPTMKGMPNVKLDFEAGVMGFYKNAIVSMGFRSTRWGYNVNEKRTTFVFGVGGYLKRYYDPVKGYCASDSRRWVSLNYMFRPAMHGKGLMIGDMGKEKLRTYVKAMYVNPSDSLRSVEASFGFVFTPVNGIIDFCIGAGATAPVSGFNNLLMDAEAGFIVNLWRIPLTVMLHESNIISDNRHLYVDFGVGFHLGEFNRSSYK